MFSAAAVEKVGTVKAFGGSTAPDGWLFCDGAEISRTTYADLFAVIGTNYGAGDGTTTFNLPNLLVLGITAPVAVYGNGKGINLTDGAKGYSMANGYNANQWQLCTANYQNANAGTTATLVNLGSPNRLIGLNQESTKSGIVGTADLANATAATQAIIKY